MISLLQESASIHCCMTLELSRKDTLRFFLEFRCLLRLLVPSGRCTFEAIEHLGEARAKAAEEVFVQEFPKADSNVFCPCDIYCSRQFSTLLLSTFHRI